MGVPANGVPRWNNQSRPTIGTLLFREALQMPTYRFELSGDPEPFEKDFPGDADAWAEVISVCSDALADVDGETMVTLDTALRVFAGQRRVAHVRLVT